MSRSSRAARGRLFHYPAHPDGREGLGPDLCIGGRESWRRDAIGIWDDHAYLAEANSIIDLDGDFLPFAAEDSRRVAWLAFPWNDGRVLAMNRAMLTAAGVDLTGWNPDRGPVTFDRLAEWRRLDRKNADGGYDQVGYVPGFGEARPISTYKPGVPRISTRAMLLHHRHPGPRARSVGCAHSSNTRTLRHWCILMTREGVTAAPGMPFLQGNRVLPCFRIRTCDPSRRSSPISTSASPLCRVRPLVRHRAHGQPAMRSRATGARNPDAAVRFIDYLTSAEVERYCLALGCLPSRKHASPEAMKTLARPSFVTDQVLATAVGSPPVPIASHFQDLLYGVWGDMVSGKVETAARLSELQSQADQASPMTGRRARERSLCRR